MTESILRSLMGEIRSRLPQETEGGVSMARVFRTGSRLAGLTPALPPLNVLDHVVSLDRIESGKHSLYSDKASRLAQMSALGFSVPPAMVLDSELVGRIIHDFSTRQDVGNRLHDIVLGIETATGLRFGDRKQPLILSVRSGGQKVMEGLLPTLQFVGLNARTVKGLGQQFGDMPGAYRLYLQYVIEFGVVIRGVPRELFGNLLKTSRELEATLRQSTGGKTPKKRVIVEEYKRRVAHACRIITLHKGGSFPQDPHEQLQATIVRIAEAWEDPHAEEYRTRYRIPHDPPAALVLQKQVFGNLGSNSAAICAYSRHPKWGVSRTKEQGIIGIAKLNASGDELMTGSGEQPQRLSDLTFRMRGITDPLQEALRRAERHFRIPVKFEVIVENGKLWILQVSPYPMWPLAVVRSAVDMKEEGILTLNEAIGRIDDNIWKSLQSPQFVPPSNADILLTGRTEIAGAVHGRLIADEKVLVAQKERSRGKAKREYILITDGIGQSDWETVFERTAGIVVLGDPGAHFFHRASQAGVAVMSRVKELGKDSFPEAALKALVKKRSRVWLDATGREAYLTATPLEESVGSVARYLRGEIGYDDVKNDRSRDQIEQILRFRALVTEKHRIEAEKVAAEVKDVLEKFLVRDDWPVNDLKEAILENRWAKETKPPAVLFQRHDGSTDPAIEDFEYEYEGKQAAEFLKGLWNADDRRPKRLAKAFVDTDQMEHAFMVSQFRLFPAEARASLINEIVRAAVSMDRKPGRSCGIYILSRAMSVLAEEAQSGADVVRALEDSAIGFLAAEFRRFFEVRDTWRDSDYSHRLNRREAEGISLRYPLLASPAKVGDFLKSALPEERIDRILREGSIDEKARAWLGDALGQCEKIGEILKLEEEAKRPPQFDREAFVAGLPRDTPESVARYIVGQKIPIPEMERGIHPVLESLNWGSFDFDVDQQQFIYKLSDKANALFQEMYRLAPELSAELLVETPQGTHALSLTFFKSLTREQQSEIIETMVRVSQDKNYRPGIMPGLYLLSRFVGVLGQDSTDPAGALSVLESLSPEAFRYVLEDFYVFHGVRTGGFRGALENLPESVLRDFTDFMGDRYHHDPGQRTREGDHDYAIETYQRYPGLDPKVWIPFIGLLPADRLEEALSPESVSEGVRTWFLGLFLGARSR